ncbi:DDE family transposase [Thermolongibacillus altinsuensis]|uniref:DDE family transposase n=1 Tax=Thermolongibacillus altinsuensis TaxID=575256 RepID=A0A4R1Q7Y0_9BACL|nr:IS982 family transposase [Thermolongibacillus altinsuensis]TCL43140.1 DDE family transposase [Thermolongibacillus altinsuensis]
MQEHFHFTTNQAKIQKQYAAILSIVITQLSYIEAHLERRNRHLLKQNDEVIIAVHILGKLFGFMSERAWHRFVVGNLFTEESFPERSRYNRRCRLLRWAIKWIRHQLKHGQHHAYAVVDSLPIELCHSARISRVKRLREVADTGYCASKKAFFYGVKLHIQITDQSLPMGYVVAAASYHDRTVAEEVMTQLPHPYTLGDKGYVSQLLQEKLHRQYGIAFWTPSRKNQRVSHAKEWTEWMRRKRKIVETTFSVLVDSFHITSIRANSVEGFETALDGILLAYTLVVLGLV